MLFPAQKNPKIDRTCSLPMVSKCALKALLIGRYDNLAWALPQMLTRAGFCVDVISSSSLMQNVRFVRECDLVPSDQSLIPAVTERMRAVNYHWIVVTDDRTLGEILKSALSVEDKLKLLPVQKEENFVHLYSKIGLSQVFSSHGVNTPPFFVATNLTEALLGASQLSYPVLLKINSSGGGDGVFECNAPDDMSSIKAQIFDNRILVQKKISGVELDLSALYLKGDLVHFSYSKVEKVCGNKFGPSVLRTYRSLNTVGAQIFQELAHIGKVLGAHGFTNIGCIESNGCRFYFEVDMRPNVWVDLPKHFGEDPAIRIQKWFSHKEKLMQPLNLGYNQPSQMLIPYFLRLKWFEFLFNRYDVWKFIPRQDWKLVVRLLVKNKFLFAIKCYSKMKYGSIIAIKRIVPKRYHPRLRQMRQFIRWPFTSLEELLHRLL